MLYYETILISILLDNLCYQDTLAKAKCSTKKILGITILQTT